MFFFSPSHFASKGYRTNEESYAKRALFQVSKGTRIQIGLVSSRFYFRSFVPSCCSCLFYLQYWQRAFGLMFPPRLLPGSAWVSPILMEALNLVPTESIPPNLWAAMDARPIDAMHRHNEQSGFRRTDME